MICGAHSPFVVVSPSPLMKIACSPNPFSGRTTAKALLAKHSYDERVVETEVSEAWFGSPATRKQLLDSIGVVETAGGQGGSSGGGAIECQVCFADAAPHEASAAACGHFFCNECWGLHIKAQVSEHQLKIHCQEFGCSQLLGDDMVAALTPADTAGRFRRFALQDVVAECNQLKKCCNPRCELVLKLVDHTSTQDTVCDKRQGGCGATSCGKPGCTSEAHY
eukprot:SAG22_NODE_6824_length_807_cov_0.942090_2_plen_221_part_01